MSRTKMLTTILFGFVLLISCGQKTDQGKKDLSNRTINVVTTTGMITDAAQRIGGDRVNVIGLMGAGIDPHMYKASEGDVRRMSHADIILYNGLHLEGKLTEVFEQMQKSVKTVAVADGVHRYRLLSSPAFKGTYDPHIWFDVTLWMDVVEKIRDSFIEINPDHIKIYWDNTQAYLKELAELQQYIKNQAEKLPLEKRVLITAHDAFNYFGRAYDFDVHGLQGISTASAAGTADVQTLSKFIVENKIPAVFVETSVPHRTIEALQAAVQSMGFNVIIGGDLFSDAMGNPDTPEGTYIGMIRHNMDTIVNALIK